MELFAVPPLVRPRLYAALPSWWERVECCHVLTVPTPPVLAYFTNLVVVERPGTAAVRKNAALEFFTKVLVRFLHAAKRGVVGFNVMTLRWVKMVAGFFSHLVYLAYYCSEEVEWSSIDGVHRCFS